MEPFQLQQDRLSHLAAGLAVASVVEIMLWGILAAENGRSLGYLVDQNEITAAVFGLACAITGAIVLWQDPRHALGWLFVVVGQLATLADVLGEYAGRRPALPGATAALFLGQYIWLPGLAISAASAGSSRRSPWWDWPGRCR